MQKVKWQRFIFGFLLIGVLALAALEIHRGEIEQDLKNRTSTALKLADLSHVVVSFSGRDAFLSTEYDYPSQDVEAAVHIIESVYGVRVVRNASPAMRIESPYRWLVVKRKDNVKLKAFVPSEKDRKTILGFAKANLPGIEVEDKMKVAKGSPPRDVWLGGVSFGLQQAELLHKGEVSLVDTGLIIKGRAKDAESYEQLQNKLKTTLPEGIAIAHIAVKPPKVKPYTWSAKLKGHQVVLSGYVPNKPSREKILKLIGQASPHLKIVDGMQFASGAPKHWNTLLHLMTYVSSSIKEGQIVISDKLVDVSGVVRDQRTAYNIEETLVSRLPEDYSFQNRVKVVPEKKTRVQSRVPYQFINQLQ